MLFCFQLVSRFKDIGRGFSGKSGSIPFKFLLDLLLYFHKTSMLMDSNRCQILKDENVQRLILKYFIARFLLKSFSDQFS